MKKLLSAIMAVMMLLSVVAVTASAEATFTAPEIVTEGTALVYELDQDCRDHNGILYTLNDEDMTAIVGKNTYSDSASAGDPGDALIIPEKVTLGDKTYLVTAIGRNAFDGTDLSVFVCSGAVAIGEFAFAGCNNLVSVMIPFATEVAGFAFWQCPGLIDVSVASAKSIGGGAFWGCSNLSAFAALLQVETIMTDAFKGCDSLDSLTLFSAPEAAAGAFGDISMLYVGSDTGITSETYGIEVASYAKFTAADTFADAGIEVAVPVYYNASLAGVETVALQVSEGLTVTEIASPYFDELTYDAAAGTISGDFAASDTLFPVFYLFFDVAENAAGTLSYTVGADAAADTGYITICAHEETKTVVITAATCTEDGESQTVCADCGTVLAVDTIEAKGHSYKDFVIKATCTEGGYTRHICQVCTDRYTDAETEATGHTWDEGEVIVQATTKKQGLVKYACLTCGATNEVIVPKIVYGDVNLDGKINLNDASIIMKVAAKWAVEGDFSETNADANGDGKINLVDASLIMKYAAKWEVEFGPQK